ncbi:hypothetical protein BU17DRAFT_48171, partial [Hysterangium stoloniferum]
NANNAGETVAILVAARRIHPSKDLLIRSDSKYVLNSLTRDLAKHENEGCEEYPGCLVEKRGGMTFCVKVNEHSGDVRNEGTDALAAQGAAKTFPRMLHLDIEDTFKVWGIQSLIYRGLLEMWPTPVRNATADMADRLQFEIEDWSGRRSTEGRLWKSTRN